MDADYMSLLTRKVINILIIKNEYATSMGVIFGVFLNGLKDIFLPQLKKIECINCDGINWLTCIALGILVSHLIFAIYRSFIQKDKLPQIKGIIRTLRLNKIIDEKIENKILIFLIKESSNLTPEGLQKIIDGVK